LDPTWTTHRFEGIFFKAVLTSILINIHHRNERNILSNLWYKQKNNNIAF
jgi:hypothetical protein